MTSNRLGLSEVQALHAVGSAMSVVGQFSTLEVVAVGDRMGLSVAAMANLLNRNSGRNWTSKVLLPSMPDEAPAQTSEAISSSLQALDLASEMAADCGASMPLTRVARNALKAAESVRGSQISLVEAAGISAVRVGEDALRQILKNSPPGASALKLGYVGLGAMGGALAGRLLTGGRLEVYDRRADASAPLVAQGAIACADLPALARSCDVIFLCLPTAVEVAEVLFGEGGLAEGLSAGMIIVDQTTADPVRTRSTAAQLDRHGVALVDATVSGVPRVATAGTISILCGGAPSVLDTVQPVLEALSPNIAYCGDVGTGHAGKLINHAVAACNRLLTYEYAGMALKFGLPFDDIRQAIDGSFGASAASEKILPALPSGAATANLQLRFMVKDLGLASQMAASCEAPMAVADEARRLFESGAFALGDDATLDAMARQFEDMADLKFADAEGAVR
jgi:3-hydroxyisobutyrate dehydrogenase